MVSNGEEELGGGGSVLYKPESRVAMDVAHLVESARLYRSLGLILSDLRNSTSAHVVDGASDSTELPSDFHMCAWHTHTCTHTSAPTPHILSIRNSNKVIKKFKVHFKASLSYMIPS